VTPADHYNRNQTKELAMYDKMLANLLTAAVGLGWMTAASAHHSFTMFDKTRTQLIEGTVAEWQYNSPHIWLYIDAPDAKGELVRWGVEGGAPLMVIRQGVRGDSFRLGEHVRIVMTPMRDGRPAGAVCFVVKDDGQTLMPNDGSCSPNGVLKKWQDNGWLQNGKHGDEHPYE